VGGSWKVWENTNPSKKAGQVSRIEKFKVPDSRFLFPLWGLGGFPKLKGLTASPFFKK